ncbi:hypothetical protein GCM10010468_45170 [Actinocorallia longicatena]|uniref:DAGKc domain-containing protein n=1 Tax=Actinocorallia longicatena TaxID=111803 RepID=A0ABP6QCS4_9ACTN
MALAAAALLVIFLTAGLRSVTLLALGAIALAVTAAALWWVLSRTGVVRVLAAVLAVGVPIAVLLHYRAVGLLWVALVALALWIPAVLAGRHALSEAAAPPPPAEYPAARARQPFLIMNPRSGGGKVERFGLAERARAFGAEVVLLDPAHPQDVAELAEEAVGRGADLLGVAGGDGTQALVAEVAARHDVPFLVIPAGTRNHFALDLGLDREDPATSLEEAFTDGVELRVDLGTVGDRVFVNNASFGAYAEVVQSPEYRDDKVRTVLRILPDLLTRRGGARLTLRAGGVVVETPQAVLVSNNPYQGGDPAGLGRRERLDTGRLGVLAASVDGAAQAVAMLQGRRHPGLAALTPAEAVIDADASEIPVGVDGEALVFATPVLCRIEPGALRVRVPRHRKSAPRPKPPLDWRRLGRLAFSAS